MKKLMLIISLLSVLAITNAQTEEKELKMPPEITEIVLTQIKSHPHVYLSEYDRKYWSQVENLELGRPFPEYIIENDTLKLSGWLLPFLFNGEPLFLARGTRTNRGDYVFLSLVERDKAERIFNYEYKDSIVGILEQRNFPRMTYLIIRKENRDIFVEDYDKTTREYSNFRPDYGKTTREYFKNENSFSEVNNLIKDITQKRMQRLIGNISIDSLPKNELEMTPEIEKMVVNEVYSDFINGSDINLSRFGIKNRKQLEHLHLGKPIPVYMIDYSNEKLRFTDAWEVPMMSDGKPLFNTRVKLEDDGQYTLVGWGGAGGILHNYEYKDLIIGGIRVISPGFRYLIIRKENKNIIVQVYNSATGEYFKEYSLREVIKQIKD
ncbi:MAG: hypothetical protein FWC34_00930 [Bacteroidetes bacterium]|nr:hypothetical protein [Bacteroidota bacterium]